MISKYSINYEIFQIRFLCRTRFLKKSWVFDKFHYGLRDILEFSKYSIYKLFFFLGFLLFLSLYSGKSGINMDP